MVVLFDSSSTHTFVAKAFVDGIGMRIDDLGYDLVVLTPTGVDLTTGECVRNITIVIQQCVLLTDLTMLLMREFDVIFIMDWMTNHRALIDYDKNKVRR